MWKSSSNAEIGKHDQLDDPIFETSSNLDVWKHIIQFRFLIKAIQFL